MLVEHLHAALVVVGENFRFGHKAAGDVALLERLGPHVRLRGRGRAAGRRATGTVFSSTYIRACVDAGDVAAAAAALGRPHRLEGVVVRGDQRGRELGFPTANLLTATATRRSRPTASTRPGWSAAGRRRPLRAAVSIGTNPTFSGRERRVEAYVLDFDGDLYGERLALDFVARLREMRRYDGVEPLVAQIPRTSRRPARLADPADGRVGRVPPCW